ncbi:hypothetical protein AGMMS50262_22170 [Bacteroidia bacterium]|nr:hypothetical protein AGMMS50262_22170 [Bacteroidia bacterium]
MIISSLLSLVGCSGHTPTMQDMIGIWKSGDESVLILKEDSSFIMENVKTPIFGNLSGQTVSGKGKWFLIKNQGCIDIRIKCKSYSINGIETLRGYNSFFSIVGSGLIGNKPPWEIYTNTFWYEHDEKDYTVFKKVQ